MTVVPVASWPWLAVAACCVIVALSVTGWAPLGVFAVPAVIWFLHRGWWLAVALPILIAATGLLASDTVLPAGSQVNQISLSVDARQGQYGFWSIGTAGRSSVFVELPSQDAVAGDQLQVLANATSDTVNFGGRPHQVVVVEDVISVTPASGAYRRFGNTIREFISSRLSSDREQQALLAGFLVGDVAALSDVTVEDMRRAGLSHFVAVSGSNVMLFLGMMTLLSLPLGIGVRQRSVVGLAALPVFLVATRFEASVVRASLMAAIVLLGRLFHMTLDVWQVISLAIVGLLLLDPWIIRNVGFQLSVAATCGVVVGSRVSRSSGWLARALSVTAGAQVAVAPLLLIHFGTLPLLSPLSNLVAGPLVALATALAIPGVIGLDPALSLASGLAGLVIEIARVGSGWPQVGWIGFGVAVVSVIGGTRLRVRHPGIVAVAGALIVSVSILPRSISVEAGDVIVLDVGQGDGILIFGGEGRVALVDGGRDPVLLLNHLRRYGVKSLDLLVVTHGDADHAGSLSALPGLIPIAQVWEAIDPHTTEASQALMAAIENHAVPKTTPSVGDTYLLGDLAIQVLGPGRRFAAGNDQSIVLLVTGRGESMLLTGDVEEFGQKELPDVDPDILQIPHHGSGTSDPEWLESMSYSDAVISVGDNTFGHPTKWVIDLLERSGAAVFRTDLNGSVVFNLGD